MQIIIERIGARTFAILVLVCLATAAAAGDYDFEAGLTYRSISSDSVSAGLVHSSSTSSENDRVALAGSWYYSGLSDNDGPRSRSAFLDRVSGVRLAYTYATGSFVYKSMSRTYPLTIRGDSVPQLLDARLRHVWTTSGWYGLAGFTKGDSEVNFVASEGTTVSWVEPVFSTYTVGIGKYLGHATTLDLSVVSHSDWDDLTTYVLSFSHIGLLGDKWHWAADLDVEASEGGYTNRFFTIGLSLFPTNDFEFGIKFFGNGWSILDPDLHGDFTTRHGDQHTWGGVVSWFVREDVSVNASYRNADYRADYVTGVNLANIDQLSVGVNVRF